MNGKEFVYPGSKALNLPSYFSTEDAEKLLEEQERLKEFQARQQEYVGYEQKPWWERAARSAAATLPLEKLPMDLFSFGVTPKETQALSLQSAEKIAELQRKQRVSEQASTIVGTVNLLRAANITFESEGELEALFNPIRGKDWSKEDREWVLAYARASLGFQAGGEEVLPPGLDPNSLLAPPEDVEVFFGKTAQEQSFIGSTVAMSKDISEVVSALNSMYEPLTPPKDEKLLQLEEKIKEAFSAQGLEYFPEKSLQDSIILYNDYAGLETAGERLEWLDENQPAIHDKWVDQYKQTSFTDVPPEQGYIDATEEERGIIEGTTKVIQDTKFQDVSDVLWFESARMWSQSKEAFLSAFPNYMFPHIPEPEEV